ncbi:MAG: class I SAM-dependent methyltransferase [Gammaproteobacteria bacterium]|nr:class I SAM-dependent methyltransferase [Gammaproteobacteria bacterium]MDH5514077.1 class I SAM-dependent methyltransferase [Gammaproteobacteria bacterium]
MTDSVAEHYTHGSLLAKITAGIESIGKTPASVTVDELAPVDEFHIGGRQASEEFTSQLGLGGNDHVLDVGCGIGGTSRFVASRFGCRVTGIDLTPEFIETGTALCQWVGLDNLVELHHGNALDMPFTEGSFDAAIMLHVGMNIADKAGLFSEVYRLLRPGAVFGVYDVMKTGNDELKYPVPWSSVPDTSALATQAQYVAALQQAGFDVIEVHNRREFAADFFAETRERMAAAGETPPPLGVHIAMGENAPAKITNMVENIAAGCCAPVEIIVRRT